MAWQPIPAGWGKVSQIDSMLITKETKHILNMFYIINIFVELWD